jgi:hypothetical protein
MSVNQRLEFAALQPRRVRQRVEPNDGGFQTATSAQIERGASGSRRRDTSNCLHFVIEQLVSVDHDPVDPLAIAAV